MTIIKRNWQLKQLGITQWILRYPSLLYSEVAIKLLDHIRLLLISDQLPPIDHPLIIDVARSMRLTSSQLYGVKLEHVILLPESMRCHCWCLGLKINRDFSGIVFHTPPILALSVDANAKRKLWRQISDYEYRINIPIS
ncbi:DNA polymerase III subunit psi [Candidatus Gullanella endobia]|uniref:DNA polymerase III subunit psi n=1 Tax=Candidatus Gullanella endobia TaxID=1070130 RepID=A0A143WQW0_9ENTR|nr:DNA polymerase III subunit psi [Candidatus Gullanella endobia]CUX96108.1 DNA polymerase III subunit psi [Candidatus Gullanella endobia]